MSNESANAESPGDEIPPIEDAYLADDAASTAQEQWHPVEEDDPSLLDRSTRALEGGVVEGGGDPASQVLSRLAPSGADAEVASGPTAGATEPFAAQGEPVAATSAIHLEQTGDWEHELSAHRVAVELRRIESDVRAIIDERDPKRKRKLSGTHRWHELEDDVISWRFNGRFDEDSLRRLQELIGRRHYLFHRLHFLASTRPTWNT